MPDPITLDFLAAQQQRILDELAAMRSQFVLMQDDIRVLTARAIRQDTATRNTLDLLHRTMDRVARLEDAARAT
jgi:RecA/RadA recombinase